MKGEALLVDFLRRPLALSPYERQKNLIFNPYIYNFLDDFCVLIVTIRC